MTARNVPGDLSSVASAADERILLDPPRYALRYPHHQQPNRHCDASVSTTQSIDFSPIHRKGPPNQHQQLRQEEDEEDEEEETVTTEDTASSMAERFHHHHHHHHHHDHRGRRHAGEIPIHEALYRHGVVQQARRVKEALESAFRRQLARDGECTFAPKTTPCPSRETSQRNPMMMVEDDEQEEGETLDDSLPGHDWDEDGDDAAFEGDTPSDVHRKEPRLHQAHAYRNARPPATHERRHHEGRAADRQDEGSDEFSIFHRLNADFERREIIRLARAEERRAKEVEGVTFKPKINKTRDDGPTSDVHSVSERLYNHRENMALRREAERQQQEIAKERKRAQVSEEGARHRRKTEALNARAKRREEERREKEKEEAEAKRRADEDRKRQKRNILPSPKHQQLPSFMQKTEAEKHRTGDDEKKPTRNNSRKKTTRKAFGKQNQAPGPAASTDKRSSPLCVIAAPGGAHRSHHQDEITLAELQEDDDSGSDLN